MGDIITNPPTTPNTVSDSWQPLVDRDTMSYFGKNKITLTNWDASTTAPAIAQGSTIDINGSIARFTADEAIGGAPADGTVYLMFVVSGSTVTAEWTAEAPTWAADKGGWYTAAGNRCSGHVAEKDTLAYTIKRRLSDESPGSIVFKNYATYPGTITKTTLTYTTTGTTTTLLSPGIHYITVAANATSTGPGQLASVITSVEAFVSPSWETIQESRVSVDNSSENAISYIPVISDGVNYRVRAVISENEPGSSGTATIVIRSVT